MLDLKYAVHQLVGDRKRKRIRSKEEEDQAWPDGPHAASPCTSMVDLQAIDWRIQYADGTTKIKLWELILDSICLSYTGIDICIINPINEWEINTMYTMKRAAP
jgi:hypothetical protein